MPSFNDLPRRPSVWSVRPRTSPGIFTSSTDSALPTTTGPESQRRLTQDFGLLNPEELPFPAYIPDLLPTEEAEYVGIESEWTHVHGESSRIKRGFDQAASGMRTLVRRASNSMQKLHSRPSKSRKGSRDITADASSYRHFSYPQEERGRQIVGSAPAAPRQEKSTGSLRRAFSRRERRSGFALQAGHNASSFEIDSLATSCPNEPGASARAAAAAYNAAMTQNLTWKKRLVEINRNERYGSPGYADSCADSDMEICTTSPVEPRDQVKVRSRC